LFSGATECKKWGGIVALVFLSCVMSVGCVGDGNISPDGMPSKEFLEKVNASQEYYDTLVLSDPDNAEAWVYRGMFYNDNNIDNFSQYDEAMISCEKALELDPEYGMAWFLKGIILMNTGKNDAAKVCFQNATKYDPGLIAYIPSL